MITELKLKIGIKILSEMLRDSPTCFMPQSFECSDRLNGGPICMAGTDEKECCIIMRLEERLNGIDKQEFLREVTHG